MADKKIEFTLAGKGFGQVKKDIDTLNKALNELKQRGIDVNKSFGAGATGAGSMVKFNKDLSVSIRLWKDMSKESREFMSNFASSKSKDAMNVLKTSISSVNKEIEKNVKSLKQENLEAEKRLELEQKLLGLMTQKSALNKEMDMAKPQGIMGRVFGGNTGKVLAGAATAGTVLSGISAVGGGLLNRLESQQDARVSTSKIFNDRAIEAMQGKAYREIFLRNLRVNGVGMEGSATGYARKATKLQMIQEGNPIAGLLGAEKLGSFGASAVDAAGGVAIGAGAAGAGMAGAAALGFGSVASGGILPLALGAGALAYGGYKGIRGLLSDPKAREQQIFAEQYERGRQRFQEGEGAIPLFAMENAMANADSMFDLRRKLGSGIFGSSEFGTKGILGAANTAGFGRDRAISTIDQMYSIGGARALGGNALTNALQMQRSTGVEGAGSFMATMSGVTGAGSTQSKKALEDVLATGVGKALGREEFKLERESYVQAVMEATRRVGSNQAVGPEFAANMAKTLASMLPSNFTTADLNRVAASGLEGRASTMGASFVKGPALGRAMALVRSSPGAKNMSELEQFGTARRIVDMNTMTPESVTMDNPDLDNIFTTLYPGGTEEQKKTFIEKNQNNSKLAAKDATFYIPSKVKREVAERLKAGDVGQARSRLLSYMTGMGISSDRTPKQKEDEAQRILSTEFGLGAGATPFSGGVDIATSGLTTGREAALASGEQATNVETEKFMPQISTAMNQAATAASNFSKQLAGLNFNDVADSITSNLSRVEMALRKLDKSADGFATSAGVPKTPTSIGRR